MRRARRVTRPVNDGGSHDPATPKMAPAASFAPAKPSPASKASRHAVGISAESAGARAIHMQLLTIPPGRRALAHKHATPRARHRREPPASGTAGGSSTTPSSSLATSSTSPPMCRISPTTPARRTRHRDHRPHRPQRAGKRRPASGARKYSPGVNFVRGVSHQIPKTGLFQRFIPN
jgi:hypothetical protein